MILMRLNFDLIIKINLKKIINKNDNFNFNTHTNPFPHVCVSVVAAVLMQGNWSSLSASARAASPGESRVCVH